MGENLHTYIQNWLLQPFSQDYGLDSSPLTLRALILYVSGGSYKLTSTSNGTVSRNLFVAGLFNLRVFAEKILAWYRHLAATDSRRSLLYSVLAY